MDCRKKKGEQLWTPVSGSIHLRKIKGWKIGSKICSIIACRKRWPLSWQEENNRGEYEPETCNEGYRNAKAAKAKWPWLKIIVAHNAKSNGNQICLWDKCVIKYSRPFFLSATCMSSSRRSCQWTQWRSGPQSFPGLVGWQGHPEQ